MKAFVAVFFSVIPHILNAQVASTEHCHCYRISDKITVVPIYNVTIGDKGENVVWDFSRISADEQSQDIELSSDYESDSTIAKVVGNTRYYYCQDSCAIRCTGYENSTVRVEYDRPTVVVPFPIATAINKRVSSMA